MLNLVVCIVTTGLEDLKQPIEYLFLGLYLEIFPIKKTVVGVLSFLITWGREFLRFINRCSDCSMFARSFMKSPVEAHYRVRKLCQVRRHFGSEPVGTPRDDSCGEDCCVYNPPLARRPTAMSHSKMFEQACEHRKGWRVALLSLKKQSDGGGSLYCLLQVRQ